MRYFRPKRKTVYKPLNEHDRYFLRHNDYGINKNVTCRHNPLEESTNAGEIGFTKSQDRDRTRIDLHLRGRATDVGRDGSERGRREIRKALR